MQGLQYTLQVRELAITATDTLSTHFEQFGVSHMKTWLPPEHIVQYI